jgi:hypothetical protein
MLGPPAPRILALSFALTALVAAADETAGHRVVLIGLLITGQCTALDAGRWLPTALAGHEHAAWLSCSDCPTAFGPTSRTWLSRRQ